MIFLCSVSNEDINVAHSTFALFQRIETTSIVIVIERESIVLMHCSTF